MSDVEIIEAILFSSGKPMRIPEIERASGLEADQVRSALKKLTRSYRSRNTALEIAKIGPKYVLQLREDYKDSTESVAQRELPHETIKIAALIAYYQPMKKKELVEMVGSSANDHVKELKKRRLITVERGAQGNIMLNTTTKFFEFFGLEMTKPEELKQMLMKKAGLK
ncbi:MAG: SMC-Scp complex subunit ScpB [Thermoplasmata archaeon]|nr:SMC-Scp complex subunit ScpB [Thermoplasmata archaeon]